MSTEATVQDLNAFREALADVRNDNTPTNWALLGHVDGNPAAVHLVGSGSGGTNELASHLSTSGFFYGLLRVSEKVDMSDTVKFVYIHWLGEDVPFAKKGRFGVVHGSIQKHFHPYHVEIEANNVADVTEEAVLQKVGEASLTKTKVLESTAGRQERTFTASPSHQQSPHLTQNKSSSVSKPPGAVTTSQGVEFDAGVSAAVKDVRSDSTPTNWALTAYDGNDAKRPIVVVGSGTGGASELSGHLTNEMIAYGIVRVTDVYEGIPTTKFVHIVWIGNDVKPMTKAKISVHKGAVDQAFAPYHVSIMASQKSEISDKVIMDKVSAASGSKSFVH